MDIDFTEILDRIEFYAEENFQSATAISLRPEWDGYQTYVIAFPDFTLGDGSPPIRSRITDECGGERTAEISCGPLTVSYYLANDAGANLTRLVDAETYGPSGEEVATRRINYFELVLPEGSVNERKLDEATTAAAKVVKNHWRGPRGGKLRGSVLSYADEVYALTKDKGWYRTLSLSDESWLTEEGDAIQLTPVRYAPSSAEIVQVAQAVWNVFVPGTSGGKPE